MKMQSTSFQLMRSATNAPQAWRLQDAKSQFSALVDNALRGVPQHVTRRGKQAVVVLSEQDFEALTRGAANRTARPVSFIEHLLAMPIEPPEASPKTSFEARSKTSAKSTVKTKPKSPTRKAAVIPRLDLQPREIDWS
jgi:antitoxin Phd